MNKLSPCFSRHHSKPKKYNLKMLYTSWQHKFLNAMAYMMPKWNVYEKYTKLIQSKHQQPHTVIKYDIELINIYIYIYTQKSNARLTCIQNGKYIFKLLLKLLWPCMIVEYVSEVIVCFKDHMRKQEHERFHSGHNIFTNLPYVNGFFVTWF